jgi:hypothetical protein
MATLDLTSVSKPTDGRQETQHGVDVGTVYTLIICPLNRLIKSVSVRGNDGGLIWAHGAAEGGTPNANDPKVPQAADDQVFAIDFRDVSRKRVAFGLASQTGTVQAVVNVQWR